MENSDRELERVLDNPSNLILSEGLEDILEGNFSDVIKDTEVSFQENNLDAEIYVSDEVFFCQVTKIARKTKKDFVFRVFAPAFPIKHLLEGKEFSFYIQGVFFSCEEKTVVYKSDGTLTFSAQRIIRDEEI